MDKDINRIKVVLAEKKRTNKWLAEQLCLITLHFCGVILKTERQRLTLWKVSL